MTRTDKRVSLRKQLALLALVVTSACIAWSPWRGVAAAKSPEPAAPELASPDVASAGHGPFHAVDSAILFPNTEPDALFSIEDFGPELLKGLSFDAMIRGLVYSDNRAVEKAVGAVEESTAQCMAVAKNWKIVAMRLDPFVQPGLGFPKGTNAALDVPFIRVTFQPFCYADRAPHLRGIATDAAIRFAFVAADKADAAAFLRAWDGLGDAVVRSSRVEIASSEKALASSAQRMGAAKESLIRTISALRDARERAAASTGPFDRQAASLESSFGLPALDTPGQPKASLVHPLLTGPEARSTSKTLFESIRPFFDLDHLESAGMMSSARGGLSWIFSRYNPRKHALAPLLVTQDGPNGTVDVVSNLGTHDFQELGDRKLTAVEKKFYGAHGWTGRMDDDREQAERALAVFARQNDPRQSSHFQQSCIDCHASQERGTAAMQARDGAAPREFGYFFRAFGYVRGEPFASRRLFREVDAVTEQLNEHAKGKGS